MEVIQLLAVKISTSLIKSYLVQLNALLLLLLFTPEFRALPPLEFKCAVSYVMQDDHFSRSTGHNDGIWMAVKEILCKNYVK